MVMRIWFGKVPRDKSDEFERYLRETGGVDIPATPGNRGVYIVRTERRSITIFGVFSIWESEDAIRAFAGPNARRARYYPRDSEFLLEMPPYRRPRWRSVLLRMYRSGSEFVVRAGTVIFAFSIVIWALTYFPRPASVRERPR